MKVLPCGTPWAVLDALRKGPIPKREMVRQARRLAGSEHGGDVALLRLVESGLVVCEYRMTPEGAAALAKANQR